MQPGPVHDSIKPMTWLLGTWLSNSGKGKYPTIEPFDYCEEVTFQSYGQPIINYVAKSWHPTWKKPMHFESGFLRINPGTNIVAFMVAHNFGLTTLEEGSVSDGEINLNSTAVTRMAFAKDPAVIKTERTFRLCNGKLIHTLKMETYEHELQEHLCAIYEKIKEND